MSDVDRLEGTATQNSRSSSLRILENDLEELDRLLSSEPKSRKLKIEIEIELPCQCFQHLIVNRSRNGVFTVCLAPTSGILVV